MSQISELTRAHERLKQSVYSLPQLSSVLRSNIAVSEETIGQDVLVDNITPNPRRQQTTPALRELYYGQTLGLRSKAQADMWLENLIGAPDLVHWGRYYGTRSSQYLDHDFISNHSSEDAEFRKNDDGYIGYYHYANGIGFLDEKGIEEYIFLLIGITRGPGNEGYVVSKSKNKNKGKGNTNNLSGAAAAALAASNSSYNPDNQLKREMMVTFCTYNVFHKSDFRARYVIYFGGNNSSGDIPVKIDRSYLVVPNNQGKTFLFNVNTIQELSKSYWDEVRASQLIRLFSHLDDPSRQLMGLVNYRDLVETRDLLLEGVRHLVRFLPRGGMTDFRASNGYSSGSGDKRDGYSKTSQYKNSLVDTILRMCQMDCSGAANDIAVDEIHRQFGEAGLSNWTWVILQIWKTQNGANKEQNYIQLIHKYLTTSAQSGNTTQRTLILLEQVRFLIGKGEYRLALKISELCVKTLPLDFDAWYALTLSYILCGENSKALLMFNSIPVLLHSPKRAGILQGPENNLIEGIPDLFTKTFLSRLENADDSPISERTFQEYFPTPVQTQEDQAGRRSSLTPISSTTTSTSSTTPKLVPLASISKIWNDFFLFNPNDRHPFSGNVFYQSPLLNASARELSSVDRSIINVSGPSSAKMILAAQSCGTASSSILDFDRKCTWGRGYDLITFFVALVGWDEIVQSKEKVFESQESGPPTSIHSTRCEKWLDQLLLIVYEDLKCLMAITAPTKEQQHSALEWNMIGLLGWSVKYNIKESICAMITSVKGSSMAGGFDYFGTIKLLQIYDELVLSDVRDSNIDSLHEVYDGEFYSNKLLLELIDPKSRDSFIKELEEGLLPVDFILLILMKLMSWNYRWYQYIPNHLVMKILSKLCLKYDVVYVRGQVRVVFETNKISSKSKNKKSILGGFWGTTSDKSKKTGEFTEGDTIIDHVEEVLTWIDSLRTD